MTTLTSRALLGLGTAAGLVLALGACGAGEVDKAGGSSASASKSPTGAASAEAPGVKTVTEGWLKVCTNPPYAPFEDTDGDQVIGFDMDLTSEVAKDLGLEIEFVVVGFESIESGASLDTDACDIGASALTITEDRLAKLDFSDPYYETTMGLLVKAESGISSLADLEGKAVGVQQGTTGEDWANAQPELTEIRQYEGLGDQVTALKAGDVAGIFNDEPTLTPYEDEGFKVVSSFATGETFGFAVKKGNAELLAQINTTLARLQADGSYDGLLAKWFADQE
ncbi:MAG: transporter substrate-binding domain-containing protein [Bifidobacteriaceae bacterium]|jgi:polar amino acid transport system substrate-binding protein|nr:transporter substrate-binding domain-containing protein [Bifidobacteriaceae bacterium]